MDRYIDQLIEELAIAAANPVPETDFGENYEKFEEIMFEMEQGKKISAKKALNISYEELPPVEMLNDEQLKRLIPALINAIEAQGTGLCFPGKNVPNAIIYSEIRELFIEGFYEMTGWTMDFCSGYCPDCSFLEYCDTAADCWTKEELEEERSRLKDE